MVKIADIYFSDLKRTTVYRLPIIPETMPELSVAAKNEEFETFDNNTFNFIGNTGLVSFSIDSFLPEKADKYKWAKSQMAPYLLINLWRGAMATKVPLRCIMERGDASNPFVILNWMVTIESMSWYEDKVGDVKYKIDCKEYREVT